jgi:hypothetical protein
MTETGAVLICLLVSEHSSVKVGIQLWLVESKEKRGRRGGRWVPSLDAL